MSTMSFSQSYILASKVRVKLTKEASNPRSSLRNLVVQANMLDNIMDYISEETEKRNNSKEQEQEVRVKPTNTYVSFSVPSPRRSEATSVTEYEVGSDSDDSDEEIDYDYELESSDESEFSDSDDDYYYSSDDEDIEDAPIHVSTFKELPSMNLALSRIEEEGEEEEAKETVAAAIEYSEVPELCRTLSLTDDEEEIENHTVTVHRNGDNYVRVDHENNNYDDKSKVPRSQEPTPSLFEHSNHHINNHLRNNAIYSMEHIF